MEYKEKVTIPAKENIVIHKVAPCVRCDSEDLYLNEYEDQYGFISTVRCKGCGQEVKENCTLKGVIEDWNSKNDTPTLLKSKTELIATLKQEIRQLKIDQAKRNRLAKQKSRTNQ